MRTHVLTALAVGFLVAVSGPSRAADESSNAGEKGMKQLEGTWEIVSITRDGKKVSPSGDAKMHFVVHDGRWSVKKGDDTVEEGTFKIDRNTTPHGIDVTPTTGKHKGQTMHGIFEVKGDTARDCFPAGGGKERPKSFSADEGSGCRLTTYRRVKP